jgi:hypothetical protein
MQIEASSSNSDRPLYTCTHVVHQTRRFLWPERPCRSETMRRRWNVFPSFSLSFLLSRALQHCVTNRPEQTDRDLFTFTHIFQQLVPYKTNNLFRKVNPGFLDQVKVIRKDKQNIYKKYCTLCFRSIAFWEENKSYCKWKLMPGEHQENKTSHFHLIRKKLLKYNENQLLLNTFIGHKPNAFRPTC